MRSRGSVLIHVLITSVLVSVIAAGLVKMLMMRHAVSVRTVQGVATQKKAEASFHRLISYWNIPGQGVCASGAGYVCSGTAGVCGCTCTAAGDSTVVAAPAGGRCRITVTAPEVY